MHVMYHTMHSKQAWAQSFDGHVWFCVVQQVAVNPREKCNLCPGKPVGNLVIWPSYHTCALGLLGCGEGWALLSGLPECATSCYWRGRFSMCVSFVSVYEWSFSGQRIHVHIHTRMLACTLKHVHIYTCTYTHVPTEKFATPLDETGRGSFFLFLFRLLASVRRVIHIYIYIAMIKHAHTYMYTRMHVHIQNLILHFPYMYTRTRVHI